MSRLRVGLVIDSGTDVRLVDSLSQRAALRVLARRIDGGREISQAPAQALEVEVGPPGRLRFAAFVARRLLTLRSELDVVVVQGYGATAAFANVLGRITRTPVLMLVCSPAEAYYRCRRRSGSNRPFRRTEYVVINICRALNAWAGQGYIALSPYLASVIRSHAGDRPISVIPVYGVDRTIFRRSPEPKSDIRRRLGMPDDRPLIFFSSRIAPEKDAETVLCAVRVLAASGRDVRLLHLSGGHREFLELARTLGVAEHVIAADAVPPFAPLADCYRASDVCVQASHEEGLGFSVLEALACGTPVVASAVGGLTDTVRDGQTGWQVPPGDADALAFAIGEILDSPVEAARRTTLGEQEIDRRYRREDVFDAFVDRLRQAAGRERQVGVQPREASLG